MTLLTGNIKYGGPGAGLVREGALPSLVVLGGGEGPPAGTRVQQVPGRRQGPKGAGEILSYLIR